MRDEHMAQCEPCIQILKKMKENDKKKKEIQMEKKGGDGQ